MTITSGDPRAAPESPPAVDGPVDIAASLSDTEHPHRRWTHLAIVGDLVVAGIAGVLAGVLRFGLDPDPSAVAYPVLGVLATVSWPGFLAIANAYDLRTSLFGIEELRRVLHSGMNLIATLGMAHFVFRLNLSRGYVGILVPTIVTLTAGWRMTLRAVLSRRLRMGIGRHRVVAVGPVQDLCQFVVRLQARPASIDVVAFVADDLPLTEPAPAPLDRLLRLPDREAIQRLAEHGVSIDLLVRAGRPGPDEMASLGTRAHRLGVPVAIGPHQQDTTANMAVSYIPLGSTPLLVAETPTLKPAAAALKAVLDRVIAVVMLVAVAPLWLVVAGLILVRDGRPVLFRQERVGHDGTLFRCLKFRTMCSDAEAQLEGLRAQNEGDGPLFKLRDDPRVTRTGRWLRAHSIDELPQLWNVLKGEMSIVGPHPPLPNEVATYDERTARRLLVKPGLTGLWQVEGRSDLPWDDGVYLDLMYVDHWSPLLDFVIMVRTAKTVLRPRGAY